METAVSLPDDLFDAADDLARRTGRSRSQLYADALREYLARQDDDAVTAALDAVCGEIDTRLDPDLVEAARGTPLREPW